MIAEACQDQHAKLPPCVRPFLALCPLGASNECLYTYRPMLPDDCRGVYELRMFAFIRGIHLHLTRLATDYEPLLEFLFNQVSDYNPTRAIGVHFLSSDPTGIFVFEI